MSKPEKAALAWHVADALLAALVLGFALGGLIGNRRIASKWVLTSREIAR